MAYRPKIKRMKWEGPECTTPVRLVDDVERVASPRLRRRLQGTPVSGPRKRHSTDDVDINTNPTGCEGGGVDIALEDSPCSSAEYSSLKLELKERNSQRDTLIYQIKDMRENNKKYKDYLDNQMSSKRQQVTVLQKTQATQLSDRDQLIASLQAVIHDHEASITQLQTRLHSQPPDDNASDSGISTGGDSYRSLSRSSSFSCSSSCSCSSSTSRGVKGVDRLVADIKRLQEEKAQLFSELTLAQTQIEACREEHLPKIAALQKSLSEREEEGDKEKQHGEDEREALVNSVRLAEDTLREREGEWLVQEADLKAELAIALAQKDSSQRQLNDRVTSLKDRHASWQEKELTLRAEISGADTEKRQMAQQLRDLRVKWTTLQAKDPDVITKIVMVEVESEDLKGQVSALTDKLCDLQQRYAAKDTMLADLTKQTEILNHKVEKGAEERKMLQDCLMEEVEKERESKELAVSDVRRQMERETYQLQVTNQQMRLKVAHLASSFDGVKQAYLLLSKQARQFPQMVTFTLQEMQQKMLKSVKDVSDENKGLVRKYHKEMKLRKKYHNELVELKGNIRVLCRVRPQIKEDGTGTQADSVVTYDPDDDGLIYVGNKGRIQTFEYDRVFAPTSSQKEVFDEVSALVTSCVDGFNICIFAYGQTGSGKTYTMEGPADDQGINQRALSELFAETAERGQDWTFTIEVSVLEIYNETIRDLLSSDSEKLDVKMKPEGKGYHVPGLVTVAVSSSKDVNQVFAEGKKNRVTAMTNMNEHSSRSHCLLCITVTGQNNTTNTRSIGRLNLVDLAGSERVSKSGADGARLKEAQSINKSLSCLGDVIHALRARQSHIPFRNSKLTYLLQESLGGDSKTLMIVQVAPVEKNVSETICSLNFGQRVRTVELGAASQKIEMSESEKAPLSLPGSNSPALTKKAATSPTTKSPTLSRFTPSRSSPALRTIRSTPRK